VAKVQRHVACWLQADGPLQVILARPVPTPKGCSHHSSMKGPPRRRTPGALGPARECRGTPPGIPGERPAQRLPISSFWKMTDHAQSSQAPEGKGPGNHSDPSFHSLSQSMNESSQSSQIGPKCAGRGSTFRRAYMETSRSEAIHVNGHPTRMRFTK
jgi:hypothetical protein